MNFEGYKFWRLWILKTINFEGYKLLRKRNIHQTSGGHISDLSGAAPALEDELVRFVWPVPAAEATPGSTPKHGMGGDHVKWLIFEGYEFRRLCNLKTMNFEGYAFEAQ